MSRELAYRIDGALSPPQAFYRVACDPRRSVVVEACAGAGKTWMLVSRILRALLDGAEPQQILAITFTRKAAGEMNERLQQWLRDFALSDAATREAALRERGCDAQQAHALAPRLAELHERLLAGGRAVEIRTFHGWFSQLLRAAPTALLEPLGLQGELDLLEDRSDLQPHYWRRFLGVVAADAALRADFAALVQERGRHVAQQWLEAALEQRVELERADAAGVLEASVPDAAALWPAYTGLPCPAAALRAPALVALLHGLAGALGRAGKVQVKAAQALEAGLAEADDEAALAAVSKALFTGKGAPRKLGERPGQAEACAALDAIREAQAQQAAHVEHARLVRLSRALLASYRDIKRERGLADMADLEICAEHLLADADLAGWVQQRLDARLRHLLIDEFQDTSPLQWRTLQAWLGGYAGAGGGASGQQPLAVFIVGDPKQSIYRFRRADPRVFAEASAFVAAALDGARLACDHTRRNAPAVLATLNAVFTRAQAAGEFDGFREHTTDVDAAAVPGAEVVLTPPVPRPPAARREAAPGWRDSLATPRIEPEEALRMVEARQVVRQIEALLDEGFAPGQIQVLGRRRAALGFVAEALHERGIAHDAPEQRELLDAIEVRDLVTLLDVLASPTHALSLAQVLRSPLFGVDDAALVELAQVVRAAGGSWWQALVQGAGGGAGHAALARARELLPRWAEAARRLPPHDLLDRIVAEGEVRERYAAVVPPADRAQALAAIDALLAQSLLLDGARHATPYNFVRALKRRRLLLPPRAAADAVQLLTIHGAKGLEARAVFLVDAEPQAAQVETATLLIDWPADAAHPHCCAFVASEARCPPSLRALMAAERAGRAREELNALYVAVTRARERLYLSATAPHRAAPGPSAWQRLADAGVQQRDPPIDELDRATASRRAPHPARALLLALPRVTLPAVEQASPAIADDSETARLGRAVHRVLEWLPPSHDLARAGAAAAAEFGLADDAGERVAALAGAVLASPACRRFFEPDGLAWAGNEVPLAWRGALLRIDRLVALDEPSGRTWWVLDYKLRHAPQQVAAYREQLAAYRDAVRALQPGAPVRAGFITGGGALVEL